MAAAAAATPAVHAIVKEAVDAGAGLYRLYTAFKIQLQPSAGDAQRGEPQRNAGNLREDMKAAEKAMQRVFDNQASLLALFSQGSVDICGGGLDALQSQINKGFDSVTQTVEDEAAIRAARDLKMKLDSAMLTYDRLSEDIVAGAESRQKRFSPGARRDIEKAESSAVELYNWAKSFVLSNPGVVTKQLKLRTIPYIVTMAYAARVQAITHILERDMMDEQVDKITCLKRARKVVDDFIAVLETALEALMPDTSLLEVAMDYQLPMAIYLTLIASFRASVEELLAPSAERKDIAVWDDGLAPIRDALRLETAAADNQEHQRTIYLDSVNQSVWWATFTDADLDAEHATQLRVSIDVRELCHVLGAANDERLGRFALQPGQKSALLQLPPASALRAALCANIARARQAAQAASPPPPPQSFARTSEPPAPPDDAPCTAGTANVRCTPAGPRTLTGHTNCVYGVAVCADGERIISGDKDHTVKVWSLSSGQLLRTLSGHTNYVTCVAVNPDSKTAVSSSCDKSVRVWSVESGLAKCTLQGHSDGVWAVAVSPDGRSIASGSLDKTVKLWNAESGQCQATLTGHCGTIMSAAFSPDGETLVSGSRDNSIRVWNVRTRALERTLHGHSNAVRGVAVTPDGRRVVSGSEDRTVKVWNLSSGAEEMAFTEHTDMVVCVAVFPNGRRIVSGSHDNSIRVWNLHSRKLELTLTGHSNRVRSVAVPPGGRSVVSGSEDNTIKVWALSGG